MPWHQDPFLILPADGLILVDSDLAITHVSKAAREILGTESASIVVPFAQAYCDRSDGVGPADVEMPLGDQCLVLRIFTTDDGFGIGILAPGVDRAGSGPSFALYDQVLRKLNESVLITTAEPIDRPGPVIVYVNDAFLANTGYSRDEVLGRSPRILQGAVADDERKREFRGLLQRWASGRIEIANERKDGSSFWVEIDFVPIADETGWFTNWVSVQTIVTERHDAQAELGRREERYRLLAENSLDVIIRLSMGTVIFVSPSLRSSLGWQPSDWVGQRIDDFVHPDDLAVFGRDREALYAGRSAVNRYRVRTRDGSYHWVESRAKPHFNVDGLQDGVVASLHVVDSEVQAHDELDRRARIDELTGLLNRKEIIGRIAAVSSDRRREDIAVLFCDIDKFKDINDSLGHAAGDAVLREMARRLQGCLRSGDVAARVGGDEILVLLTGMSDLDDACATAERIRQVAAIPVDLPTGPVTVTISIGVALSEREESEDSLIARADRALYQAKQSGRDRVMPAATPVPT